MLCKLSEINILKIYPSLFLYQKFLFPSKISVAEMQILMRRLNDQSSLGKIAEVFT